MNKVAIYPGTFDPITFGHIDVIKKGLKLFDKIVVAVSNVDNKKYLFDFEEIPEVARRYITLRAGRKFQENILGSSELTQLQFKDEQAALMNLKAFESQTADYNIFDNYDTYAAVDRGLGSPVNTLDTQRRLYS